uniref:Uncharacterized protein n=1 Tax=Ditylenchus dipsaci TaxID=166011 RepID=A0A915DV15_9BILA
MLKDLNGYIEPVAVITLDNTIDLHDADLLDELCSDKFGIVITERILQCLKTEQWLNGDVISCYLQLLAQRSLRDEMVPKILPIVHCISDFLKEFAVERRYDEVNPSLWIGACAKDIPTQSNHFIAVPSCASLRTACLVRIR